MPDRILEMLVAERDRLQRAIDALSGVRRRGRPPKSAGAQETSSARRHRRRGMSPAARKRQSERMKAYWAARRKSEGKTK